MIAVAWPRVDGDIATLLTSELAKLSGVGVPQPVHEGSPDRLGVGTPGMGVDAAGEDCSWEHLRSVRPTN